MQLLLKCYLVEYKITCLFSAFVFDSCNEWNVRASHPITDMKTIINVLMNYVGNVVCKLTIANMATVRKFEDISAGQEIFPTGTQG
jgi:hypothetical protein